jgi:hypothetical protein
MGPAQTVINTGSHVSYPFIFEFGGTSYCAPELSAEGGLHLFRMGASPLDWVRTHVMLDGLKLLDPTLFRHGDRWWLLATIEGPASDTDLFAWHAPSPFGPWIGHVLNPVKSDAGSVRPAGAVWQSDDCLYRPAQDCLADYGTAVVINRIIRLSPVSFEEEVVTRLSPAPDWEYPDGLHTVNGFGDQIIIDAKRRVIRAIPGVGSVLRRLARRPAVPKTQAAAPDPI